MIYYLNSFTDQTHYIVASTSDLNIFQVDDWSLLDELWYYFGRFEDFERLGNINYEFRGVIYDRAEY